MKKLISISLFSVALLTVSCQKEDLANVRSGNIAPSAPVWKKATTPTPDSDGGTTSTGTGITDPNNDPDMNSKKGNKQ